MLSQRLCILAALCSALLLSPAAPAPAEDVVDEGHERCINRRRIADFKIIDQQNIVFYMRDRTIYVNELPRRCSVLRPGSAISYNSSSSRLCNNDFISVVDTLGREIRQGPLCAIGKFRPINIEEAEALRGHVELKPEPVPPAEPEEPEVSE